MASNLVSNLATAGSSALSTSHHGHPRGRGTYVPQACSVCRHKKTKCDGQKPICGGCKASKRGDECSWGKDATPLRKNRNEAFFEALKKRNDALKEYCTYLETLLERCRREHGGLTDSVWLQRRPATDSDLDGGELIPFDDPDTNMHECSGSTDVAELEGETGTEEGNAIQGLIAPIQKLTLVCGSLMTYGSTAVYRFRPVVVNKLPSRFPKVIEDPRDSYILLVEGADQRYYNPTFEWNRYLPRDVPLTRSQHDKALDLMFKFCLSWCLRIIPTFFLRDMCRVLNAPKDQKPPQTAHYSPMLHNVLVALAVCLLDEPTLKDPKVKQRFVDEAKKYIDTECSQPNLSTVHALSTLGTFHSSQGDQTLGFMYFGMSARVSQALGLDVDCSEWVKSGLIEESDVLDRYWTYWTIFAQDVNWSLYVGRDFCVRGPTESDFKDMPIPFIDSEFDQMPFHHPPTNLPARPAYLSKNFASACELLVIARRIMSVVNGISKTRIKASVIDEMISDIDLQLNTWKDSLPPEVDITPKTRHMATPHQLMVHIAYWWFFILLHRPYFHRKPRVIHSSDKEIDHVKLCKRGADNIMELTKTWHEIYGLRYCPLNIVQPLFAAGTIFLLSGIQAASGVRVAKKELKNSFDSLKLCINHLREVGKSWPCAATVESILRGLIEERLKPAVEKRKVAAPRGHHARSASEGGDPSIYMANPPSSSRRPTSLRRSRAHNAGSSSTSVAQTDALVASPLHSPTISVSPALDEAYHSRHLRHTSYGSQPMSANQELLSPWSAQSGSPGSQPIPIRNSGGASSNGSSSSGSPVSVRMSASPTRNFSTLSSSPTTPDLRHTSPSNSFTNGNLAQSFSNDTTDPIYNLFTSFDAPAGGLGGGIGDQDQQPPPQFDMSSIEFSQYFAMLGGQPFSAMPFVGPIPNNNSESAVGIFDHQGHQQQQQQQQARAGPLDLSDLDFFQHTGPEHLTGDPVANGGFYPPFGGGGMPSTGAGGSFAFHQRRATSENFRTGTDGDAQANGNELFTDFDFTATFQ